MERLIFLTWAGYRIARRSNHLQPQYREPGADYLLHQNTFPGHGTFAERLPYVLHHILDWVPGSSRALLYVPGRKLGVIDEPTRFGHGGNGSLSQSAYDS